MMWHQTSDIGREDFQRGYNVQDQNHILFSPAQLQRQWTIKMAHCSAEHSSECKLNDARRQAADGMRGKSGNRVGNLRA